LPTYTTSHGKILLLQPVHNIFLLVAAEIGLVCLTLFMIFLWKTYKNIRLQRILPTHVLSMLFFSVLFLGMFDHYFLTLQQGRLLLSLILGIIWAKQS
jgi:hypothetical protein